MGSEKEEEKSESSVAERTKTEPEIRSGKSRENTRFLRKQPVTETFPSLGGSRKRVTSSGASLAAAATADKEPPGCVCV